MLLHGREHPALIGNHRLSEGGVPENSPTILESLESFYRSNYGYITNLARFIFWPCVTIVMGLLVGEVVYAMFAPAVELIHYSVDAAIP